MKTINLYNTHGGTVKDAREALHLITSGEMNVQSLLSGELPLEEVEAALKNNDCRGCDKDRNQPRIISIRQKIKFFKTY